MALTAEQEKRLSDLIREHASDVVGDMVEEKIAKTQETAKEAVEQGEAPPVPHFVAEAAKRSRRTDEGLDIARMIGCYLAGKGDLERAQKVAEKRYGAESRTVAEFTKALAASDSTAGGFLVQDEVAAEIIELLRPASVVRTLGPRMAPMDTGTLRLPKITGGASGGYIGENANITASEQTFGQVVANAKKLAVLTPVSNDLIRRASANAEAMVRDDLRDALAQRSDLAFIRGDGTSGSPKGLKDWAATANNLNASTHAPASVTLANVTTDLGRMLQALADANVPMRNPGWIMEPRTWRYLITVRDGNGNLVFKDEMDGGTLFGIPFGRTSQIPRNLDASGSAGNDETEVYLADFADVVIAESESLMIDVSTEAAYHDGSNVVAAFSQDQTVIRAIMEHDLVVRHEESVVLMEQVVWGG
jgi:HK97 family phage major capsid protein